MSFKLKVVDIANIFKIGLSTIAYKKKKRPLEYALLEFTGLALKYKKSLHEVKDNFAVGLLLEQLEKVKKIIDEKGEK